MADTVLDHEKDGPGPAVLSSHRVARWPGTESTVNANGAPARDEGQPGSLEKATSEVRHGRCSGSQPGEGDRRKVEDADEREECSW